MAESLTQAIALIKAGRKEIARPLLEDILVADPHNETAWAWYVESLPTSAERIEALEECLQLNPDSKLAQQGLERFKGTSNLISPESSNPVEKPQESPSPVSPFTTPLDFDLHSAPPPSAPPDIFADKNQPPPNSKSVHQPPPRVRQTPKHPPKKGMSTGVIAVIAIVALLFVCVFGGGIVYIMTLSASTIPSAPVTVLSDSKTPMPTRTPLPTLALTPTKTDCDCADAKAYIERSIKRLNEMESEAKTANSAIKGSNFDRAVFTSLSGSSKVRYGDQVAEMPPPCLRNFQIKIVGYFSNWYRGMESIKNGEYRNTSVYMQSLIEKQSEMLTEANNTGDKFKQCDPGGSSPQA